MDFTPDEIEQMAAGMRQTMEPPTTPGERGNDLLTEVRRIIKTADGEPDQLEARYAHDYLAIVYNGHEFAHYKAPMEGDAWIEFEMYPALHDKYAADPRFADVEDKDRLYWRVYLRRPQDVSEYADVILDETL